MSSSQQQRRSSASSRRWRGQRPTWARIAIERIRRISRWRRYIPFLIEAVKRVVPEAKAYLIGSVAEGTYTALSDVDVLLVLPGRHSDEELYMVFRRVWEEACKEGLPWDYPLDLIVVDEPRAGLFLRSSRRVLKLYNGARAPRRSGKDEGSEGF